MKNYTPRKKGDGELFQSLKEWTVILDNEIDLSKIFPEHSRVLLSVLRLLLCDSSKKTHGGLLLYFVNKYNVQTRIILPNEEYTLDEYLGIESFRSVGSEAYSKKLIDLIEDFANESGSHESKVNRVWVDNLNFAFQLASGNKLTGSAKFWMQVAENILIFSRKLIIEVQDKITEDQFGTNPSARDLNKFLN